jgi:hypothetical protein
MKSGDEYWRPRAIWVSEVAPPRARMEVLRNVGFVVKRFRMRHCLTGGVALPEGAITSGSMGIAGSAD